MAIRLPLSEAAKMMGVTPDFLRAAILAQKLPPDVAFAFKTGKKNYRYFINRLKFKEYLGLVEQQTTQRKEAQ